MVTGRRGTVRISNGIPSESCSAWEQGKEVLVFGRVIAILAILMLILWVGSSFGATPSPSCASPRQAPLNGTIQKLLQLSGLKEQIAQMPALVQMGAAQGMLTVDAKVREGLLKELAAAYDANRLLDNVTSYIDRHVDEAKLKSLLAWYEASLGLKIAKLESEASRPEAMPKVQEYIQKMATNPPSPELLKILKELDEVARATDFAIEGAVAASWGVAKAMQAVLPEEKRIPIGQLESVLQQQREQTRPALQQQVLGTAWFSYRDLTLDELKKYVEFYRTDSGKWWAKLISSALLDAMAKAADDAGQKVVKFYSKYGPATTK